MIFGIILVLIGVIFLLQNLEVISGGAWKIIWPIVVILIGVGFIVNRWKRGRERESWIDRKKIFQEKMGVPKKEGEKWHRENE